MQSDECQVHELNAEKRREEAAEAVDQEVPTQDAARAHGTVADAASR